MAKKKSASKSSSESEDETNFENAMEELETIVQRMERGGTSLDEALDDYTSAIKLMKVCHKKLEQAERRIEILTGVDAEGNAITDEFRDTEESLDEKRKSRSSKRTASENQKGTRKKPSKDSRAESDESSLF